MKVFNIMVGIYLLIFNIFFINDTTHHRHVTDLNVIMLSFIFSIYVLGNILERFNRGKS